MMSTPGIPITLLLVMLGGAVGAGVRWWVGAALLRQMQDGFPWGTFAVNVVGAFFAGYLAIRLQGSAQANFWRALCVIGFLGGLTTFSSLMVESLLMAREARALSAVAYLLVSLLAGLLAVWLGARLADGTLR